MSHAVLDRCNIHNTKFLKVNMKGSTLNEACINKCQFVRSNF
jgi:uncharacterized protein YjbI with pentapeptide repeats